MAGERFSTILAVYCLIFVLSTTTAVLEFDSKPKCCNTKLMDSAGYVMIESNARLEPNKVVKGLLITLCAPVDTVDTFAVQVWRRVPGTSGRSARYRLYWSKSVTSDKYATGLEEQSILDLEQTGETFTIGEDDYLALWAKEASRIPVPFDFDAVNTTYSFYLTDSRYASFSDFRLQMEVGHKDYVRWPRSFKTYLKFCETTDCSDQNIKLLKIVGPPGPPGPQGPPGAPGEPIIIGQNPISGEIQCDVPLVEEKVDDAQVKIQILSNQVSEMQQALNAIYNSNSVTGICPTGMLAGTYGVGSCYMIRRELVSMGVAELRCRRDFDAHLISIETEIEERFIRNEILRSGTGSREIHGKDMEEFWTAAMYNKESDLWIWYHESRLAQPVLQYTNWRTKSAPRPNNDQEVCTVLNVNVRTTTSDWRMMDCNKYRFYICEVSKKCL